MNAYATLVMKEPHYINGALALAQSLRQSNTQYDIVCMITPDIIQFNSILLKLFDKVITVPYLSYISPKLKTKKQNDIYNEWKDISYTKWNCLMLPYKKICFLDADLVIQKNIDDLFKLPAPAGCFGNNWSNMVNYYGDIKHGEIIPNTRITKGLSNGYLVNGHCIIIEPNISIYNKFIDYMKKRKYIKNYKCLAMVDEFALVNFMINENKQWTQIGKEYNYVPWKNGTDAYILHFFNKEKPWMLKHKINEWADLRIWFDVWDSLCTKYPSIKLIEKL